MLLFHEHSGALLKEWMHRKNVKEFLGYGETALIDAVKKYKLVTCKLGNKIFFNLPALLKIMNENIVKYSK